jgi:uncharacterized membrane protein YjfL (UPF0719 family)
VSGDEVFALVVSVVFAVIGVWRWYGPLVRVTGLGGSVEARMLLAALPAACGFGLFVVLEVWAAREVREGPEYVALFMAAGAAWLAGGLGIATAVGVSFRDDAVERHNPAAGLAVAGAVVGTSLCFIGSNIGEGATIWTTFLPAFVGTVLLWWLWLAVELATRVSDAVTIDRDVASGLRLAGFLAGAGLVLGHGGAGDWRSLDATLADFARLGWPTAALALAAAAAQWVLGPTPTEPRPPVVSRGLVPGMMMVLAAVVAICVVR